MPPEALLTSAGDLAAELSPDELHAAMAGHPGSVNAGPVTSSPAPNSPEWTPRWRTGCARRTSGTNSASATSTWSSLRAEPARNSWTSCGPAGHDPVTELAVVNAELAKITVVRLGKLVTDE